MAEFSGTHLCPNNFDSTDSLARKMESDNKIIKDRQINGSILVQKSPSENSVSEEVGSAGKSSMPNKDCPSKGGLKDVAKLLLKDTYHDLFHLGKSMAPVQDSSKLHDINRTFKEYQRHQKNRTSVEIRKTAASSAAIANSTIQPNFQKVFDNHLPKPFQMIKDSSANISKYNLQNKYPINYANHLPKTFPTKPYERKKIRKDSLQTSKENNVRLNDPRLESFNNARLRDPRLDPFNILKRKHQPKEISLICLKYSQENDGKPKELGDPSLKISKVRPNNTSCNTEKCSSKMKNVGNKDRSTPGLSTKSSLQVSSVLPTTTLTCCNSTSCATLDPNQMSSSLLSFKRGVGDPSDLSVKYTYSHPTPPKTRNEVILQTNRSCSPFFTDISPKSVQASSPIKTSVNQSSCDISNKALSTPAATLTSKVHSNQSSDTRMIKMTDTVSNEHKMSGLGEPTSSLMCSKQLNCEPHNKKACSEVISNKQAMLQYLCSNVSKVQNQEVLRNKLIKERKRKKKANTRKRMRRVTKSTDPTLVTTSCPDTSKKLQTTTSETGRSTKKLPETFLQNYTVTEYCEPKEVVNEREMDDYDDYSISRELPENNMVRIQRENFTFWFHPAYFNKDSAFLPALKEDISFQPLDVIGFLRDNQGIQQRPFPCDEYYTNNQNLEKPDPILVTTSCPVTSKELQTTSQQNNTENELCKLNKVVNDREMEENEDFSISRECIEKDLDWQEETLVTERRTKKLLETSLQNYTVTEEPADENNDKERFTTDSNKSEHSLSQSSSIIDKEIGTTSVPKSVEGYKENKAIDPLQKQPGEDSTSPILKSMHSPASKMKQFIDREFINLSCTAVQPNTSQEMFNGFSTTTIFDDPHNLVSSAKKDISTGFSTSLNTTNIRTAQVEVSSNGSIKASQSEEQLSSGFSCASNSTRIQVGQSKVFFKGLVNVSQAEDQQPSDFPSFLNATNVQAAHSEVSWSSVLQGFHSEDQLSNGFSSVNTTNIQLPASEEPSQSSYITSLKTTCKQLPACVVPSSFSSSVPNPVGVPPVVKRKSAIKSKRRLANRGCKNKRIKLMSCDSVNELPRSTNSPQLKNDVGDCSIKRGNIHKNGKKLNNVDLVKGSQSVGSSVPNTTDVPPVMKEKSAIKRKRRLTNRGSKNKRTTLMSCDSVNEMSSSNNSPLLKNDVVDSSVKSGNTHKNVTKLKDVDLVKKSQSVSSIVLRSSSVQPLTIKEQPAIKRKRVLTNRGSKNKRTTLMSCDSVNELSSSNNSPLLKNDVVDSSVKSGNTHKNVTKLKDVDLVKKSQSVSSIVLRTSSVQQPTIKEQQAIKRKRRLTNRGSKNKRTTLMSCDSVNELSSSNNSPLLKNDVVDSSVKSGNTHKNVTKLKDVDLAKKSQSVSSIVLRSSKVQPPTIKEQPAIKRKRGLTKELIQNKKTKLMSCDSVNALPNSTNSAQLKNNVVDSSIKTRNAYKNIKKLTDFDLVKNMKKMDVDSDDSLRNSKEENILQPYETDSTTMDSSMNFSDFVTLNFSENTESCEAFSSSSTCDSLQSSSDCDSFKSNVFQPSTPRPTERGIADSKETVNNRQHDCDSSPNFNNLMHSPIHGCPVPVFPQNISSTIQSSKLSSTITAESETSKEVCTQSIESRDSSTNCSSQVTGNVSHASSKASPYEIDSTTMDSSMNFSDFVTLNFSENTESCEAFSSSSTCDSLQSSSDCDSFKSNVFQPSTPRPTERVIADSKDTVNNRQHDCDSSPNFNNLMHSPIHGCPVPVFPQNISSTVQSSKLSSTITSESEISKEVCPQSIESRDSSTNCSSQVTGNVSHASSKASPYETDSTTMDCSMNFRDFVMLNFSENTQSCEALSSSSNSLQSSSDYDSFKSNVFPPSTPQPTERVLSDSKETVNNYQHNRDSSFCSTTFHKSLHSPFHGCPVTVFPQNNFKTKPSSTMTSESEPSKEVCPKSIESRDYSTNCSSPVTGNLSHASLKDNFGVNVSQKKVVYPGNTSKTSETFLSSSYDSISVPVTAQKNTESQLCSSYIADIPSAKIATLSKTQKIIPPYRPFKVDTVTSKETVTSNIASEITIKKEYSSEELLCENKKKFKCDKACKDASTEVFQTDCYLKDKKLNLSQDIFQSTLQDLDLFGEGKELESYWQHLKRTGNHYINVDCVYKKENELGGQELESYYFLKGQFKHHQDLMRGIINSAQEPGTDCDTEKHQRIAHQQEMIDGYKLAIEALLL